MVRSKVKIPFLNRPVILFICFIVAELHDNSKLYVKAGFIRLRIK